MNREEKLATIYEAALRVFARYGYRRTRVEDIADELGMTKGNLYLYVENKRDLYEKAVAHGLSRWQEMVIKVPGRLKWENIVLKRGITSNMDIWKWRKQVEDGDVEGSRRDGSIVMFDQQLKEVARLNFYRAWPVKVTGPQPKADSNEIGVEELTIAHEYIHRVN